MMENKNQRRQSVDETLKIIRNILTDNGPKAAYAYLQANLNQLANEVVTIAITGTTGVGKSTFINAIRGIKSGETGYAQQGRGNTTRKPTYYSHPRNKKLRFCDLPGVGTLQFPKAYYCTEMKLQQYDIFLIFLGLDISEDDQWLAETLNDMKKPFCFIRSKIDDDIYYAQKDGINPDEMLVNIKKKIKGGIQSNENLNRHLRFFLISSYDKKLGNWIELMSFIDDNLPPLKKEIVLSALPNLTTDVIDKKFVQLMSRLDWVIAGTALLSAIPIPFFDVPINSKIIESEIKHYIEVFGLRSDTLNKLEEFDRNLLKSIRILDPNAEISKMVFSNLSASSLSVTNILIPIVGPATNTASIVKDYLSGVLKDLKTDSSLVYGHILNLKHHS